MDVEKTVFIRQIKDGQPIDEIFLVKAMSRAETRSGKPYLILTLMDRSGEIGGRLWENADAFADMCRPGSLVRVTGQAQTYRGSMQLKIDRMDGVKKKDTDFSLFLPGPQKNIGELTDELLSLAKSVKEPFCRKLLLGFFKDERFLHDFQQAPAAKSMHHAYLGGLLEHTVSVSQLGAMVAGFYTGLDRDLLVTGALLHDIGKTKELTFTAYPFDYSDGGRMVGHLVLGVEMVQSIIREIHGFPGDLDTRLQHLILSHHGRYEFGSPTLPMMSEAFVLHFLDDLDAKLNFMGRLETQAAAPGYHWSDFQRTLERFLYVKGRPHAETEDPDIPGRQQEESAAEEESRQRNLF